MIGIEAPICRKCGGEPDVLTDNLCKKCKDLQIKVGDKVEKVTGDYTFVGVIVAKFKKLNGKVRYVAENGEGLLHIYSESNLEKFKK